MKPRHSIEKSLCAMLCACLLAMTQYARACEPSISSSETGGVVEITAVGPTSTEECLRTDVHIDENQNEYRTRTTTINSDGSANPQGRDDRLLLNEEQMRIDQKDGTYAQFGGDWPDDEYTRRLPRPNMPISSAAHNEKSHSLGVMFKSNAEGGSITAVKVKAYVEQLKARGFTIDAKPYENEELGNYAYRAKNSAGYLVVFSCSLRSSCGLALYDPVGTQRREGRRR